MDDSVSKSAMDQIQSPRTILEPKDFNLLEQIASNLYKNNKIAKRNSIIK